jgi:heme exporter protein C
VVNVPIIHYSVVWWNTLHQGPTVSKIGEPSITWAMLWPMLGMMVGFMLFFGAILLTRVRGEVLARERNSKWIKEVAVS